MIVARRVLLGHAREFVETHLRDVVSWDQVRHDNPEPLPKDERGRRSLLGKFRERVVLRFGSFMLDVKSPNDEPPLGWVSLYRGDDLEAEGPLDAAIWANIGSKIRERCGHGR